MTESLVDLGLATLCETCESELEFDADATEVLCRQCGLAFLLDGVAPEADTGTGTRAAV